MKRVFGFVNKYRYHLAIVFLLFVSGVFAAAPAVPGIQDVLAIPFATLFTQMTSLVVLLNLAGAAMRHWIPAAEGAVLYFSIVALGVVLGAVGQVAGLLTVAEFVNLQSPLGGIAYGFQAALLAVGVNQGKRQVVGTSPAPSAKNTTLPKSG